MPVAAAFNSEVGIVAFINCFPCKLHLFYWRIRYFVSRKINKFIGISLVLRDTEFETAFTECSTIAFIDLEAINRVLAHVYGCLSQIIDQPYIKKFRDADNVLHIQLV